MNTYARTGRLLNSVFRRYYLPTILMTMSLSMGVIVDGIIVGNILGANALAAVNLCVPIVLFFNIFVALFGIGGSTRVSQVKGKRDQNQANSLFTTSMIAMLALSLLVTLCGYVLFHPIVNALTQDPILSVDVSKYLHILVLGAPVLILIPGATYFLRADGWPSLASVVLIVANVVNLACDYIFMKIFGMDIRGAALATVTGYLVGFFILMYYLFSTKRTLFFSYKYRDVLPLLRDVVKTGIPSALGIAFLFIKIWSINLIVLSTLGKSGMVVFSICLSCLSFVSMFISGSAQSMMPIVGTLFGEKDYLGIEFVLKRSLMFVLASCLFLVILFELFPSIIMGLFGVTDANELILGDQAIRTFAVSLLGTGFSFMMLYYFQTIQQIKLASLISAIQGFAVLIPSAYLLSKIWGGWGIWISFSIAEVVTFLVIALATIIIVKRSNGKLRWPFLFFNQKSEVPQLDVTIQSEVDQATGLSENVINFCKQHLIPDTTSMHVGLAIEEIVVNTIEKNRRNKHFLDLRVSLFDEEIVIGIKDDGVPFDPTTYTTDEEKYITDRITLIKKIATSITYSRSLGINSTILTIVNKVS